MSGGYFDYVQFRLNDTVEKIDCLLINKCYKNDCDSEDCEKKHYSGESIKIFQDAKLIIEKAILYIHEIDYFIDGDTSEESMIENIKNGDKKWQQEAR